MKRVKNENIVWQLFCCYKHTKHVYLYMHRELHERSRKFFQRGSLFDNILVDVGIQSGPSLPRQRNDI